MSPVLPPIQSLSAYMGDFQPIILDILNSAEKPQPVVEKKLKIKYNWTPQEDYYLQQFVSMYGTKNWFLISYKMGSRNPRQCRERWENYINPELSTDPWTAEEDQLLREKYSELGTKWGKISKFLKNRTAIAARNRWYQLSKIARN